ncbi:putative dNA methylase N-4/N-6 domain protein [Escherichia coli 3-267-03_S4_C2]|nr:putative dNA methylase N-4/N-6 domain protein [Escherichia coli 3-267-03_S4_C2]
MIKNYSEILHCLLRIWDVWDGEVLISMVGEVLFIMDFHGGLLVLA